MNKSKVISKKNDFLYTFFIHILKSFPTQTQCHPQAEEIEGYNWPVAFCSWTLFKLHRQAEEIEGYNLQG